MERMPGLGVGRVQHLEAGIEAVAIHHGGGHPATWLMTGLKQQKRYILAVQHPRAGQPRHSTTDNDNRSHGSFPQVSPLDGRQARLMGSITTVPDTQRTNAQTRSKAQLLPHAQFLGVAGPG